MDNYALLNLLLKAEGESEVDEVLKRAGYFDDDPDLWQPFGGFGMNLNQINNQQSDATAALVEKLINSIDAVLMAECYDAGIDPKSPQAPRTMAEAVARLFKVKDGRLENLSATERTKLADRIHFVATGTKKEPCYLVVDRGEGQTPDSFRDTFLSLTKQNKDDIPFVQGRFNCGGTGVLPFCGEHKYQLILSRRHPSCPPPEDDATKDLWGFTIVRRQLPAPGRKSSMYVYLAPQGKIFTFAAPAIPVIPGPSGKNKPAQAYAVNLAYGTCIKLITTAGKGNQRQRRKAGSSWRSTCIQYRCRYAFRRPAAIPRICTARHFPAFWRMSTRMAVRMNRNPNLRKDSAPPTVS
jgi:hypothetical protein